MQIKSLLFHLLEYLKWVLEGFTDVGIKLANLLSGRYKISTMLFAAYHAADAAMSWRYKKMISHR